MVGWKCPECGSINNESIARCFCGYEYEEIDDHVSRVTEAGHGISPNKNSVLSSQKRVRNTDIAKRRLLFVLILIASLIFVVLGNGSVGSSIEVQGGIGTLELSLPPYVFIIFVILLVEYILALRSPIPKKADSLPPAGLFRRFVGFLVDYFVNLMIISVPTTAVELIINGLMTGEYAWIVRRSYNQETDGIFFYAIIIAAICLLLMFALPVSRQKHSVGGLISGVYICSEKNISFVRSTLRSLLGFVTMCGAILSVPWAWASNDRRMWHDSAFGTFPKKNV